MKRIIRKTHDTEKSGTSSAAATAASQFDERAAFKAKGIASFSDYNDMFTPTCCVDAVIVCTPNDTHINVLRQIVRYRVHILCEKPMCTTVAHCREVQALLRREGYNSSNDTSSIEPMQRSNKGNNSNDGPLFWVG